MKGIYLKHFEIIYTIMIQYVINFKNKYKLMNLTKFNF